MAFDTVTAFFYSRIVWLFILLITAGSVNAQLKAELNFGPDDNFIVQKKTAGKIQAVPAHSRQLQAHGNFRIVTPLQTSPAGGQCLELNGTDEYLMLPPNADIQMIGNLAFSVSMWLQTDADVNSGDLVYSDNGFISGYRFYLDNGQLKLDIREDKKETFILDSALKVDDWRHVGFVCDGAGDSVIFYLDGQPVRAMPFTRVSQVNTGHFACVGASIRSAKPNFMKARIDGFRFFAGHDTVFESVRYIAESREKARQKKNRRSAEPTFILNQNYPNPFNASTRISYALKNTGFVTLKIYDLLGNRVRTLFEGEQASGLYEIYWNGTDSQESPVPSGIYMIRLEFDQWVLTRKMVLVK